MVFPNIEKIKQEYTDKYVVVDTKRPELARFADVVGQVKTVNMSGRALVEFLDYHQNVGWFDIELEFLKVVDKPQPKPKEEKKAAPPKAEAKKPEAKAAAPVAKPAAAGKPSTADILAKLRGGGGAPAAKAPAAKEPASDEDAKKHRERAPSAPPPAKVDRTKMSVADMLAAARAGGGGAPKGEAASAAVPEPEAAPTPAPTVAEATSPAPASTPSPKNEGGIVKIDKSGMSVDEMVAYCREKDAS